jgi:hypothetical protein
LEKINAFGTQISFLNQPPELASRSAGLAALTRQTPKTVDDFAGRPARKKIPAECEALSCLSASVCVGPRLLFNKFQGRLFASSL